MGKKNFSRRAEILKRVLDWLNQGKYENGSDYMIFGKSLQEVIVEETGRHEDEAEDQIGQEIEGVVNDLKQELGRGLASERTSLRKSHLKSKELTRKRSPQAKRKIAEILQKLLDSQPDLSPSENRLQNHVDDGLDQHYANEVLDRLEMIVSRVSALDRVEAAKIPSVRVEEYFQEAHRCFLYGFPIASAVLCRALLDSVLTQTIDPKATLKRQMEEEYSNQVANCRKEGRSGPPKPSYPKLLIRKANLAEDRPRVGE